MIFLDTDLRESVDEINQDVMNEWKKEDEWERYNDLLIENLYLPIC